VKVHSTTNMTSVFCGCWSCPNYSSTGNVLKVCCLGWSLRENIIGEFLKVHFSSWLHLMSLRFYYMYSMSRVAGIEPGLLCL
jgi:hypothetical protein